LHLGRADKGIDGGTLRFEAKPGPSLLLGAYAKIGNDA
jgi:hypothetical protein